MEKKRAVETLLYYYRLVGLSTAVFKACFSQSVLYCGYCIIMLLYSLPRRLCSSTIIMGSSRLPRYKPMISSLSNLKLSYISDSYPNYRYKNVRNKTREMRRSRQPCGQRSCFTWNVGKSLSLVDRIKHDDYKTIILLEHIFRNSELWHEVLVLNVHWPHLMPKPLLILIGSSFTQFKFVLCHSNWTKNTKPLLIQRHF